jgi:hypothetical protein
MGNYVLMTEWNLKQNMIMAVNINKMLHSG